MRIEILWIIMSLFCLVACEANPEEEPNLAEDNGCLGYAPFQEGWRVAYEEHFEQYEFCSGRTSILQAETDSLVEVGDSLALYVKFVLLGNVDPIGGAHTAQLSPSAYPYLIASSNKGYWKAKLDVAVMKDRFGKQKTGASAIDDFRVYGNVFLEHAQAPDTVLIAALMEQYGWSKQLAGKQAILVPLAFGRFFLAQQYQDLQFSPLYHSNDKEQSYPYTQDPVYQWASQLAQLETPTPLLPKEAIQAILDRSPEIQGVKKAMAEGKNLDGAEFRTVLVF